MTINDACAAKDTVGHACNSQKVEASLSADVVGLDEAIADFDKQLRPEDLVYYDDTTNWEPKPTYLSLIIKAAKLYRAQQSIKDEMVDRAKKSILKFFLENAAGAFTINDAETLARAALEAAWGLK